MLWRLLKRESIMWAAAEVAAFMIAGAIAVAGGGVACFAALAAGGFFRLESLRYRDIERARGGRAASKPRSRGKENKEVHQWR